MVEPKPQKEKSVELGEQCDKSEKGYKEDGFDRGFEAEAIMDATFNAGKLMFLIKFKETEKAEVVSAPRVHEKCHRLLVKYYEDCLKNDSFDRGLVVEKILGATKFKDVILFLIKYKGIEKLEMVRGFKVKVKYPQLVLSFYEQQLGIDRHLQ